MLWGIGTTIPVYDNAPDSIILAYGNAGASSWIDATNSGQVTTALVLTVVAVIAALVAATYRLDGEVSAGLLAAAAAFLVIVELIELATLIAEPDHRQGIGVLWMLIPAIAFVTTNATALRTLARRRSNSAAAG